MGGQVYGFEHGGSRRYAELANRLFGMESGDAPLPPGFILELDRPEWKILKREFPWTTGDVTVAANPANLGRIQVLNQAKSGRLSIPTHILTRTVTPGTLVVTVDAAAAATPAPCLGLDTRAPFAAGPGAPTVATQSLIANLNAVISGYRIASFTTTAANVFALFTLPYPPVLAEGHNMTVFDANPNEVFEAYIFGYERPATPDELAQ